MVHIASDQSVQNQSFCNGIAGVYHFLIKIDVEAAGWGHLIVHFLRLIAAPISADLFRLLGIRARAAIAEAPVYSVNSSFHSIVEEEFYNGNVTS